MDIESRMTDLLGQGEMRHLNRVARLTRCGNSHDSAMAESFFDLLKRERGYFAESTFRAMKLTRRVRLHRGNNPERKRVKHAILSRVEFEIQQKIYPEGVCENQVYSHELN